MKRFLTLLALLAMVLLTACGGKKEEAAPAPEVAAEKPLKVFHCIVFNNYIILSR